MKTVIAKLDKPSHWTKVLPLVLFSCRDTPHASKGFTPFELLFGWDKREIVSIQWTYKKHFPTIVITYLAGLRKKLDISKAKDGSKKHYDQHARDDPLDVGDEVLILHPEDLKGWKGAWTDSYPWLQGSSHAL